MKSFLEGMMMWTGPKQRQFRVRVEHLHHPQMDRRMGCRDFFLEILRCNIRLPLQPQNTSLFFGQCYKYKVQIRNSINMFCLSFCLIVIAVLIMATFTTICIRTMSFFGNVTFIWIITVIFTRKFKLFRNQGATLSKAK